MTKIEWTQSDDGTPGKTWNPTTGCDRVSPGCDNCYALAMARRLKGMGHAKYQTDGRPETSGPGFGVQTHPDTLSEPLKWRKPRRVFVNSMSDLFHPAVPTGFIASVFDVMARTPQHTYQVLTKRPRRMRSLLIDWTTRIDRASWADTGAPWPLPNVWLGTSVEDQKRADERIPILLATPAAVRFLSCEPLLAPVDLSAWLCSCDPSHAMQIGHSIGCWRAWEPSPDWVIVGGESGRGARPMDLAWAHSIVEQCQDAGVAAFVKQLGSRPVTRRPPTFPGGDWPSKPWPATGKGGDPAEWPAGLRVREFPEAVPV